MFNVVLIDFNYSTILIIVAIHSLFHFDAWLTTMHHVLATDWRTDWEQHLWRCGLNLLHARFVLASTLIEFFIAHWKFGLNQSDHLFESTLRRVQSLAPCCRCLQVLGANPCAPSDAGVSQSLRQTPRLEDGRFAG